MQRPAASKASNQQQQHYYIKVAGFEGPFDLLYHLIAREEMDIWDISIAHIVDQYLSYLASMQEQQEISIAGEFLVMASSLLQLKSRLLLPRVPTATRESEEDAFYFGSKEDLVRSLLAYKRYKLLAGELQRREGLQQGIFLRSTASEKVITVNMQTSLFPHSPESLVNALAAVRARTREKTGHHITLPEELSLRSIMRKVLSALRKAGNGIRYLDEFIRGRSKGEQVVSFFAFLELARRGRLKLKQDGVFSRIRIIFPNNKMK